MGLSRMSHSKNRHAVGWPQALYGSVVQKSRTPACHAGGRGFKSHRSRHKYRMEDTIMITDDPNTWGMCCSEEMAQKCAESNYHKPSFSDKAADFLLIAATYVIIVPFIFILYFILACIAVTGIDATLSLFSIPISTFPRILICGFVTIIGCLVQLNDLKNVKLLIQCGYGAEEWLRAPIYFGSWILASILIAPLLISFTSAS